MRSRTEIEQTIEDAIEVGQASNLKRYMFEILLDIRDLLTK